MKSKISLLVFSSILLSTSLSFAALPDHPLIDKAKSNRAERVDYALKSGATVKLTQDQKSYVLTWFPEGTDESHLPPIVVTLHGHGGYAFDDFYVWHPFLKQRGYGFMAIQWWIGDSEKTSDYLMPQEIYRIIDQNFKKLGVEPGRAMLHGFSRGSANIYPVAAMDQSLKNHYFSLFVANAGRANSGYPPVHEIEQGRFGERPFEGTHWVTFAGGKDTNPDRDGIPGMRETGDWIQRYGGTLDLAIEDPSADHGGFHRSPKNCEAALDVFDRLRV